MNFIINFTVILDTFHQLAYDIVKNLTPTCTIVMASLCTIDFVLTFIFFNPHEGVNLFTTFIKKTLYYSFWFFVLKNWYVIIDEYTFNSFIQLGNVGSGHGTSSSILFAPGFLVDYAMTIIEGVFVLGVGMMGLDAFPVVNVQSLPTVSLLICVGIFVTAIATSVILVIAFIKFWLSSALAIICIPFSMFSKTKQVATNALMGLIPQGLEIATLVVIMNMIHSFGFFDQKSISSQQSWAGLLGWLGYYLIFFVLLKKVPSIVGTMTSGALAGMTGDSGGSGYVREGAKGFFKGANQNISSKINDFKKAMGN